MIVREFYLPAIVSNQPWQRWQRAVFDIVRNQFDAALAATGIEDVLPEAWRVQQAQGLVGQ